MTGYGVGVIVNGIVCYGIAIVTLVFGLRGGKNFPINVGHGRHVVAIGTRKVGTWFIVIQGLTHVLL